MNRRKVIYLIVSIIFIILTLAILSNTNLSNSVALSKSIQIILILFFTRIAIGCTLYIRKQYEKQKYSYGIIMNLGLLLFIIVNIFRQIDLLVQNWNVANISDIYNNTLRSFSYFALLTLPCIIFLSIYSIVSNFVLIKKEGFGTKKMLGIVLGFMAIIGLFGSQAIYYLVTKVFMNSDMKFIKYTLEICINSTLSYFYTLVIATLYCNIKAAKHEPKYDKDYVIILGSRIRDDGTLMPLLQSRVDRAIKFANEQYKNSNKKIIYVPSGGQGPDEIIAEAQAIKNYLIEHGVSEEQILIEDKSTSTIENMKFSKDKIDKFNRNAKIIFSTNNYHVFRSGVIANEQGIDCEGIGSKTKWYFYSNALIREFIANLAQEKKKHIIMILMINLSLLTLIIIGKYYNLLVII